MSTSKKISEDQVFEAYQEGLPNDFSLKGAKIKKKTFDPNKSTVQISIKVEYDLLMEIKKSAEEKGMPYQTFIKQAVREYMRENLEGGIESKIRSIESRLSYVEKKVC